MRKSGTYSGNRQTMRQTERNHSHVHLVLTANLTFAVFACNAVIQTCKSYECCSFTCPKYFESSPAPLAETSTALIAVNSQVIQQNVTRTPLPNNVPVSRPRIYSSGGLAQPPHGQPTAIGQPLSGERSRLCSTSTAYRSQMTQSTGLPV